MSVSSGMMLHNGWELAYEKCLATPQSPPEILFLHGAGNSSKERTRYLAYELARHGYSSIAFDYSGCGASSGDISQTTLLDRLQQAEVMIGLLGVPPGRRVVIGSSMSGHIASRLAERSVFGAMVLFCPAAYPAEAEDKRFGPDFSKEIRKNWDFANSPAFVALNSFKGSSLLVYGAEDAVVPPRVFELYADALKRQGAAASLTLPDCPHAVHQWLPGHVAERQQVVKFLLTTLERRG
jgi:hypothetical protein